MFKIVFRQEVIDDLIDIWHYIYVTHFDQSMNTTTIDGNV